MKSDEKESPFWGGAGYDTLNKHCKDKQINNFLLTYSIAMKHALKDQEHVLKITIRLFDTHAFTEVCEV